MLLVESCDFRLEFKWAKKLLVDVNSVWILTLQSDTQMKLICVCSSWMEDEKCVTERNATWRGFEYLWYLSSTVEHEWSFVKTYPAGEARNCCFQTSDTVGWWKASRVEWKKAACVPTVVTGKIKCVIGMCVDSGECAVYLWFWKWIEMSCRRHPWYFPSQ